MNDPLLNEYECLSDEAPVFCLELMYKARRLAYTIVHRSVAMVQDKTKVDFAASPTYLNSRLDNFELDS